MTKQDFAKSLGQRIKAERKRYEMTQKELAKEVGLKDRRRISQFESGYVTPNSFYLREIARVLCCSADWLLRLDEYSATGIDDDD